MAAHRTMLKLNNQKNGWKGVSVHHKTNGQPLYCPVRALGGQFLHIQMNTSDYTTFLSVFYVHMKQFDVMDMDIQQSLNRQPYFWTTLPQKASQLLKLTCTPYKQKVQMHSHWRVTQIKKYKKMGGWRSTVFKKYIWEELAGFSVGMSTCIKIWFSFFNISGGVYTDIMTEILNLPEDMTIAP